MASSGVVPTPSEVAVDGARGAAEKAGEMWRALGEMLAPVWLALPPTDRVMLVGEARRAASLAALADIPRAVALLAPHANHAAIPLLLRDPASVAESPRSLIDLLDAVADVDRLLGPVTPPAHADPPELARVYASASFALHIVDLLAAAAAAGPAARLDPLPSPSAFDVTKLYDLADHSSGDPNPADDDADAWMVALAVNITAAVVLLAVLLAGVIRFRESFGYAWVEVERIRFT